MAGEAVARRYASAYFDLAREKDSVPRYGDDLARAAETLGHDEVTAALANPRLEVSDRVGLALQLIDGVGDPARNLVRLLIERNRITALPAVLEQYRAQADQAAGVVRAAVTTAVPVTDRLRTSITATLRERFGSNVEVSVDQDPAILGGLVVRVGDRVIDNSLRTHLQQLQASLR